MCCFPLIQMAMLLKLQESANYIESPERDVSVDPGFQATLWTPKRSRLKCWVMARAVKTPCLVGEESLLTFVQANTWECWISCVCTRNVLEMYKENCNVFAPPSCLFLCWSNLRVHGNHWSLEMIRQSLCWGLILRYVFSSHFFCQSLITTLLFNCILWCRLQYRMKVRSQTYRPIYMYPKRNVRVGA